MTLTMQEAIDWLESRPFGTRQGLAHFESLLDEIDHPETKTEMIHIAGTNGKGSTVSFLNAMILETGLRVGTFTSPHIERINERMTINGKEIADEAFIQLVKKLKPIVLDLDQKMQQKSVTEFELLTAMAFLYFQEQKVDVAIIEVGLGGLLDSTNVIKKPLLTAITTIGMDHTEILGNSLEKIAAQKAGIIKKNIPLVTGRIASSALFVIEEMAKKENAPMIRFESDYQVIYRHPDPGWGEIFDFSTGKEKLKNLTIPLVGRHQVENAGCAIALYYQFCQLKNIPFQTRDVRAGLKKTYWPVRMEKISEEPLVLLDGAHNVHAMKRLVQNMKKEFKQYHIHILFSALETKDIEAMLLQLLEIPEADIHLTSFDFPKALRLEKNYEKIDESRISVVSLWQFGLANILQSAGSDDLILITGSLYFIGEVRKLLKEI